MARVDFHKEDRPRSQLRLHIIRTQQNPLTSHPPLQLIMLLRTSMRLLARASSTPVRAFAATTSSATPPTPAKPWAEPMPDAQFTFMRDILAAPSPIGLESAMTHGLLEPALLDFDAQQGSKRFAAHRFRGNAGGT
jgi:hypothetical protein